MSWRLCWGLVIVLSIFTFTPVVTPAGVYEPVLFGLPRTLWLGLLVSLAYAGLTLVGTRVHPVRLDQPGPDANVRTPREGA